MATPVPFSVNWMSHGTVASESLVIRSILGASFGVTVRWPSFSSKYVVLKISKWRDPYSWPALYGLRARARERLQSTLLKNVLQTPDAELKTCMHRVSRKTGGAASLIRGLVERASSRHHVMVVSLDVCRVLCLTLGKIHADWEFLKIRTSE